MTENNVLQFKNPSEVESGLEKILQEGAIKMLKQAVAAEVEDFLSAHKSRHTEDGYLPERTIQTGLGHIPVQVPRARDRCRTGIKFTSQILPPYLKRTKNMEELLPWLYLKGLSTGDSPEALQALLGGNSKRLSSSTICRLKQSWEKDLTAFQERDFSQKSYAYWWVDGVYFQARMEEKQCMLVIMGADETGKIRAHCTSKWVARKRISWTEVLLGLKERGLKASPRLCVGDGALGFWNALYKVYGTQAKACWFHKMGNILNKLPKNLQNNAKSTL